MKKLLLVAALFCGVYSAQAIKIIYGPYLQAVTDTEATIVWVTDQQAMSWVEVAPVDGTNFYNVERPKFYQTYLGKRVFGTEHQVRITGLEPGKKYCYSVSSKEVLGTRRHRLHYGDIVTARIYGKKYPGFNTLDPKKESTQFIVLNDIHAKQEKMDALLNTFEDGKTEMVFYNGDMVSQVPNVEILFNGFVNASIERFARQIPFYLVRGNHETRGVFATKFLDYFPTPTGKTYFTLKHADTFFIILDGGEDKPDSDLEYYETAVYDQFRREEAEWLKKVVESEECKSAKRRIVLLHMPPVDGHKMWHGTKQIRELFIPILNKANISVMLCGHVHKYSFHDDQAAFPIVVNSFEDALKVKVDNGGVKVDVVGMDGAVKHTHSFK